MKKYLQSVSRISVAKKRLDLSKPTSLAVLKLTSISKAVKSVGTSRLGPQGTRADSKEYWLLQEQNILPSSVLMSCFFSGSKYFPGVSFHWLRAFDVSPRSQCDFSEVFTDDVVGI